MLANDRELLPTWGASRRHSRADKVRPTRCPPHSGLIPPYIESPGDLVCDSRVLRVNCYPGPVEFLAGVRVSAAGPPASWSASPVSWLSVRSTPLCSPRSPFRVGSTHCETMELGAHSKVHRQKLRRGGSPPPPCSGRERARPLDVQLAV
jgi:hypothetical protein